MQQILCLSQIILAGHRESIQVNSRAQTLFVLQSLGARCGLYVIMSVPGIMYEKCTIIIAIMECNYMVACIVGMVLRGVGVSLALTDMYIILHTE